jgi:CRP-like cAMP-binding protein
MALSTLRNVVTVTDRVVSGMAQEMAATPVLQGVAAASVKELAGQGSVRQYRRGTYLFYQGDPSEHVFFLWQGRIEVSSVSVTGHRQLLTTLDRPQFSVSSAS